MSLTFTSGVQQYNAGGVGTPSINNRSGKPIRTKLHGGKVMVSTRLFVTGTYVQLASWSGTTGDGLIPSSIFNLSSIDQLHVLTPPGAAKEVTTVTTTPAITARGTATLRTSTGFFFEWNDTVTGVVSGENYSGGLYIAQGILIDGTTDGTGLTTTWTQAAGAATIATSPAAIALDVLVFGNA